MGFNWDEMTQANLPRVCKQAFQFADSMDDLPKGEQIASLLVFTKLLCDHRGIDLREALAVAQNIIADGNAKGNIHIKALQHYINTALK